MLDLTSFHQQIKEFIYCLDDTTANKFFRSLKKEDIDLIESKEDLKNDFLSLQFLLLPFLPEKNVLSLLQNNLKFALYLDDIDITERLKKRLIFMDIEDRDTAKNSFMTALLANRESVIKKIILDGNKETSAITDWIKDYVSFNQGDTSALKKAQYFNERLNRMSEPEKIILKKIFSIYDFLNASSKTPEGFENDLLLKEGDKIITTDNGAVVVLYDSSKQNKDNKTTKLVNKTVDTKSRINEEDDDLFLPAKSPAVETVNEYSLNLSELQQSLKNYPESSLEHKAISQEISRLKKSEFKQSQKADVN